MSRMATYCVCVLCENKEERDTECHTYSSLNHPQTKVPKKGNAFDDFLFNFNNKQFSIFFSCLRNSASAPLKQLSNCEAKEQKKICLRIFEMF